MVVSASQKPEHPSAMSDTLVHRIAKFKGAAIGCERALLNFIAHAAYGAEGEPIVAP